MESIIIDTNVDISLIYDRTLNQLMDSMDTCSADNLLLVNALYLSVENMVLQMFPDKHSDKRSYKGGNYKKRDKTKVNRKQKQKNKKTRRRRVSGGGYDKWISKLIFSLVVAILMISKNVLSLQPEYDNDVLQRLTHAGEIKELFDNKHGTCVPNTALFLGAINLKTYEELTTMIVERHRGLDVDEMVKYLDAGLNTSWHWYIINNEEFLTQTTLQKYGNLRSPRIVQAKKEEGRRENIRNYIRAIKSQLIEMRNSIDHGEEQGILTALVYPSDDVHHVVVVWLTSDEKLVVIDPQEFMRLKNTKKNVVLFSEEEVEYDPTFAHATLENYFMNYLNDTGITLLLRDMHVRKIEHIHELVKENPMVNDVIDKIKMITHDAMA